MADSSIALEFLLSIKNGIHTYAIAITETMSPELRQALYRQMEQSIDLHAEMEKGHCRRSSQLSFGTC
ncbi:spore coat protein [Peribacillus simplex]|uniref:Spore coat protein n=2 Tax=Peribacillus simplex TaxID=1478 RepID=A0AAW7IL32_9BACI|nr:spore coat protein [Peribacillus simplex]MDM5295187.1 spore coat protein [Peribacillus simplex]MDM5454149.1 spore coat protein [Peribacillus simplex]